MQPFNRDVMFVVFKFKKRINFTYYRRKSLLYDLSEFLNFSMLQFLHLKSPKSELIHCL